MLSHRSTPTAGLLSFALLGVLATGAPEPGQDKKSKNPPPGAPWVKSFEDARAQALRDKTPIFLYSTKTY
mgnify:CR=1 FL=1